MKTDNRHHKYAAPDGTPISATLRDRLAAAKPVLVEANKNHLSIEQAAELVLIDEVPIFVRTAYKYVKLLGIKWNNWRPARARVNRKYLAKTVPRLLADGLSVMDIARETGLSMSTIQRYMRANKLRSKHARQRGEVVS